LLVHIVDAAPRGPRGSAPPVRPAEVSGGLPLIGHGLAAARDLTAVLERGYREHGEVFSLRLAGQRAVVLLGSERSRHFFAQTGRTLSIRAAYPFFVRMFDPEFYLFAEREEYLRQRDLVLPRLRGSQLQGYLTMMEAEMEALADRLGERGEFDLVETLGPLVMRIAAHAFLGPDFRGRLEDRLFTEFRRFSQGMDPVCPGWLPLPHLVRSRLARNRLRSMMVRLVRERRSRPAADPDDFLHLLCQARYADGAPVPDMVLVNLILLLTWAGHETTTGHLAWALIDLLRHPAELQRVLREQSGVLAGEEPLTLDRVHRLRHLNHALRESERLHPVAFVLARRAVEDLTVDGYHIPAGTTVLVSPALTHRLPAEHAEPDSYRPDRYAEDPHAVRQLTGFGGGVHRCLGVHFAYLEMAVVVTRLLQRYDLRLLDPDPRPVAGNKTKWPKGPCLVRYELRRDSGLAAA
jgi:sterol 14alpha-demethylase